MNLFGHLKKLYWDMPFVPQTTKEAFFFFVRSCVRGYKKGTEKADVFRCYAKECLASQRLDNMFSIDYPKEPRIALQKDDPKFIAFYLPQFYPDPHNEAWWGKGSTEWTNTTKAKPQYLGHYQPRLPGELGFYDLRLQSHIYRQIELALDYGIYGFCFYFYWFDGERLLDFPLNRFVNDETIGYPFSLCWCNEDWSRQWSGSSNTTLIAQSPTEVSYRRFIHATLPYLAKKNYIHIAGQPILTVYKPDEVPNPVKTLAYWREVVQKAHGENLYIIASIGTAKQYETNYLALGFDAVSEFSPGPQLAAMKETSRTKDFVCDVWQGTIYDYGTFVREKGYLKHTTEKLFRAVTPGFDNTVRRANRAMVTDGTTPVLYKTWLTDVALETMENASLDDKLIFINAWNEWAEGAYLEPDLKWQYGYLKATADALKEARRRMKLKISVGGKRLDLRVFFAANDCFEVAA